MSTNTYPQIDLSAWSQVGEGGNGKTYVNPAEPDVILKLNNPRSNDLASVKKEFDISKAVEGLGLPTPKMYQIVRVGDGYASTSELIPDKKSLSRICHDAPERTAEMARLLARMGKELSSTPCDTSFFPNRRDQVINAVEKASFVSKKNKKKILAYLQTVPENTCCSHGDFQPGNVILAGDKYYWIDLGRFAYGDPLFDIGHLHNICNVYASLKQVQDIFHMTPDQLRLYWDAFAAEYTGQEDHADFDRLAGKHGAIDIILVAVVFRKTSFQEDLFSGMLVRKLVKRFFD